MTETDELVLIIIVLFFLLMFFIFVYFEQRRKIQHQAATLENLLRKLDLLTRLKD